MFQYVPSRKVIGLMVACKNQVMIIASWLTNLEASPSLFLIYFRNLSQLNRQISYLSFINIFKCKKLVNIIILSFFQKGISSSGAMEVFALKSLLTFLTVNCQIRIRVLVTDRSTSVRKMLAKDFPSISHQFDIWLVIGPI